jgi:hypothetical protein
MCIREDTYIQQHQFVHAEYTGRRGHPRKVIDSEFLHGALAPSRRLRLSQLAHDLGITTKTLVARLKDEDIFYKFSTISDQELDEIVYAYQQEKPQVSCSYLIGHL